MSLWAAMMRKVLSSSLRTDSRQTGPGVPIRFAKVRVPHSIALASLVFIG
jgi:hypothetical protein